MIKLQINLNQTVPSFVRGIVLASVIRSTTSEELYETGEDPRAELESALDAVASQCRLADYLNATEWNDLFRSFNINPNRFPPAHLNLAKRAEKSGRIPYINDFVAAMNLVSMQHKTPVGGDDFVKLSQLGTHLELGVNKHASTFQGLGDTEPTDVEPGEFGYFAGQTLVCRFGFWRNSLLTMLSPTSTTMLFNVDAVGDNAFSKIREAQGHLLQILEGMLQMQCASSVLYSENTICTLDVREGVPFIGSAHD